MSISKYDIPQLTIPWIHSPFFEQLLEVSNLDDCTKSLVKHYADYGYLIIDTKIENFEHICQAIIKDLASEYKGHVRIQDAWVFSKYVKSIAIDPKILSLVKTLYQREPIPFQTLNFRVGSQQATHSDTIHFHSVPHEFMCGVWVALEDVDEKNGPLHYYPESHKLPIFDLHHLGLSGSNQERYEYYVIYEKFIQSTIENLNLKKIDITLRKGQAIIWSANLLHGGSPILDINRTRHSQVTHYFFNDCMYYIPMLSDLFLKKIFKREIINIATGEIVPHIYNGQRIDGIKDSVHQKDSTT
ncbi:phytanoyl-CoA dioxygenase [Nostoc linckia NIES-25]|nr:phytanoyl-CoA dioxygenase [Nostoc linckia NIES-25]